MKSLRTVPRARRARRRVTKADVSLGMAALALLIALTGITPADAANAVKRALNADKVNGISASRKPAPGKLLPLDGDGKLPASVLPGGLRGPRGAEGPAGPAGAAGTAVAATPGGPPVVFRARSVAVQSTPLQGNIKVLFGGEDFDPSNVFDPGPSVFRAPVAGYYAFAASLTLNWIRETDPPGRSLIRIEPSGGDAAIRGTDLTSSYYQQPVASGLMRLEKGQTVSVVLHTELVARTVEASAETTFAGWLVSPA
ncbi:MAG: hypothetical protein JHD16_01150 [Solirubrobacteraceae bacterium]|nr:hypothetical protein [Solirubrobacteraceae bacterium]